MDLYRLKFSPETIRLLTLSVPNFNSVLQNWLIKSRWNLFIVLLSPEEAAKLKTYNKCRSGFTPYDDVRKTGFMQRLQTVVGCNAQIFIISVRQKFFQASCIGSSLLLIWIPSSIFSYHMNHFPSIDKLLRCLIDIHSHKLLTSSRWIYCFFQAPVFHMTDKRVFTFSRCREKWSYINIPNISIAIHFKSPEIRKKDSYYYYLPSTQVE